MNPYAELMRLPNCIMATIGVAIGGLLVGGYEAFISPLTYIAMAAAFIITGGGNAINDYYDIEADKINRPERPIPSGRIKTNSALFFSFFLFISGISLSAFLSSIAFLIAVVNSFLLLSYSWYFQHKAYIGNIVISYLVGSVYLFGAAAFWNPSAGIEMFNMPLVLFFMSALTNLSREIVKDLEDIEGDKAAYFASRLRRIKWSIAERFGLTKKGVEVKTNKKISVLISFLFIIIAVAISPLPFVWGALGYSYLIVVALADLMFLYSSFLVLRAVSKEDFSRASKNIKRSMLAGLLAFLAGSLIGI